MEIKLREREREMEIRLRQCLLETGPHDKRPSPVSLSQLLASVWQRKNFVKQVLLFNLKGRNCYDERAIYSPQFLSSRDNKHDMSDDMILWFRGLVYFTI